MTFSDLTPAYPVGSDIAVEKYGVPLVLAKVTAPGLAMCSHDDCTVPIQRTSGGDLAAGVRAHYKTVHPLKGVS